MDAIRQIVDTVDTDGSDSDRRLARITNAAAAATPRALTVDEVLPGLVVDDVAAAAATKNVLPPVSAFPPGEIKTRAPFVLFLNTSAQVMTIEVGNTTDDTIEVGATGGSGASFTLARDNEWVLLVLIDNRWRAASIVRQTGARVVVTQFDTTTGVDTPISWTSVDSVMGDPDAFWSAGAPTRVTIPAGLGGVYSLEVSADFDQNATGHRRLLLNHRNSGGTLIRQKLNQGLPPAANACIFGLPYINRMAPGDYIEVSTLQTSGGNLLVAKDGYTDLALIRISGG